MADIKLYIGWQVLKLTYDDSSAKLDTNNQYTAKREGANIVLKSNDSKIEEIKISEIGDATDVWVDGDPKTKEHAIFSGNMAITGTKTLGRFLVESKSECALGDAVSFPDSKDNGSLIPLELTAGEHNSPENYPNWKVAETKYYFLSYGVEVVTDCREYKITLIIDTDSYSTTVTRYSGENPNFLIFFKDGAPRWIQFQHGGEAFPLTLVSGASPQSPPAHVPASVPAPAPVPEEDTQTKKAREALEGTGLFDKFNPEQQKELITDVAKFCAKENRSPNPERLKGWLQGELDAMPKVELPAPAPVPAPAMPAAPIHPAVPPVVSDSLPADAMSLVATAGKILADKKVKTKLLKLNPDVRA